MSNGADLREIEPCRWRTAVAASVLVTVAIGPAGLASDAVTIPVDQAAETRLLLELGDGSSLVRSAHFVLAHDVRAKAARRYLEWQEKTYERIVHFCKTYGLTTSPLRRRLEVVCSKDWSRYRHLADPRVRQVTVHSGYYDPASRRCYFGAASGDLRERVGAPLVEEMERLTVQHETAHQVIDAICPSLSANMPPWLSEGLACAFEVGPEGGTDGYRSLNQRRAGDALTRFDSGQGHLAAGDSSGPPEESTRRHDSQQRLIDVITTRWEPKTCTTLTQPELYAAAWSVVFHLQTGRSEEFRTYLQRLTGEPHKPTHLEQVKLFAGVIGPIDSAMTERVVDRLLQALKRTKGPAERPSIDSASPPPTAGTDLPDHEP